MAQWPPGVVVDGVRSGGHLLSDSAPKPVVLTSSSAPCAPEEKKTPAKKGTSEKRSRLSSILSRSNGEGFFTLVTSAFSRTPGEESMVAAISSRRNARAAPPERQGRRKSKRQVSGCGNARTKGKRGVYDAHVPARRDDEAAAAGGKQARRTATASTATTAA